MTKNEKIVIHHVGGRGGTRSFPLLKLFESDIINIIFDADEECIDQIKKKWSLQPSETIVLPYCLSAQVGKVIFNINYDPYSSSIYPFNHRYAKYYFAPSTHNIYHGPDCLIGDSFKTVRQIELNTTTLDHLVYKGSELPPPDYLSIDTQGSEMSILEGSEKILSSTVLVVQLEVEFHQLYKEQPLFGDISKLLDSFNFNLVDLELFSNLYPIRGRSGFRGKGYAAHGEALFLRNPDTISCPIMLKKLAFISTVYGQFETAQQCLMLLNSKKFDFKIRMAETKKLKYLDFLEDLEQVVKLLPMRSAPLFSDIYTSFDSEARFKESGIKSDKAWKQYLKGIPSIVFCVRFIKKLFYKIIVLKIKFKIQSNILFKKSGSNIEKLLLEYEMYDQYYIAMKNRILDNEKVFKV
jgi:FkbM family methyltransferase